MPFGFDRHRDRDDRDDRGRDYGRREFMTEDDYRRRFEHDRDRGEVQRYFFDRDDTDEMRYGHPSLRADYDRDRDWVSRDHGYRSRDEDRYYGRGPQDDDRRRFSESSRDDRMSGREGQRYPQRGGYGERSYGGYGEYGNGGRRYSREDDDRRYLNDRNDRDMYERGELMRGRDRDDRRR